MLNVSLELRFGHKLKAAARSCGEGLQIPPWIVALHSCLDRCSTKLLHGCCSPFGSRLEREAFGGKDGKVTINPGDLKMGYAFMEALDIAIMRRKRQPGTVAEIDQGNGATGVG